MKFTTIFALIASASAIKLQDAPAAPTPGRISSTGNTWNYKTTGGHPSVFSLPSSPPTVASYKLGGDGANHTGGLNQPQKGLGPSHDYGKPPSL